MSVDYNCLRWSYDLCITVYRFGRRNARNPAKRLLLLVPRQMVGTDLFQINLVGPIPEPIRRAAETK